jgi:hypothetical protein
MLLESVAGWLEHALSDDVRQHVAHSLDSIFVALEALVEGAVRSAQQRIAGPLYDAPDLGGHALPDQDGQPLKIVVPLGRLQPASELGHAQVARCHLPERLSILGGELAQDNKEFTEVLAERSRFGVDRPY